MQVRGRLENARKFGSPSLPKDTQVLAISECPGGMPADYFYVRFGVPWSPQLFLLKARALEHPFAGVEAPDETIKAVFHCCTMGPDFVAKHRKAFLDKCWKRARELESEEERLIDTLHPDVRPFARKKRPLLTREILIDYGFPAADLVYELMTVGAPMFGKFPTTGIFPF